MHSYTCMELGPAFVQQHYHAGRIQLWSSASKSTRLLLLSRLVRAVAISTSASASGAGWKWETFLSFLWCARRASGALLYRGSGGRGARITHTHTHRKSSLGKRAARLVLHKTIGSINIRGPTVECHALRCSLARSLMCVCQLQAAGYSTRHECKQHLKLTRTFVVHHFRFAEFSSRGQINSKLSKRDFKKISIMFVHNFPLNLCTSL